MSTAQVLLAVREFEDLVLNSRLLKSKYFFQKVSFEMNFTKKVFYKYTYRPLIIYQTIWGALGFQKVRLG